MDFFARQERSRRTTRYLVVVFGLTFITVALLTGIAVAVLLGMVSGSELARLGASQSSWSVLAGNAALIAAIAALAFVMMTLASLYRSASLSRGGGQIARMMGATEIGTDDTDPLHRRLLNVVEEMAIASGLPVPDVYVLRQESGINAFAAGLSYADAVVAVTQGALERLDRAELQGVIAHEFSHILNGDMNLNQRLVGFSFGILALSLSGRWLLRGSRYSRHSRRGRGTSGVFALGLALTAIGGIGVLFSRLIKAAVSRERETLADASAVQFTRQPAGLAGALKKIGGYTAYLTSVDSEEVAHMLFERGGRAFRGWFATHPPLVERIRALEPSFDEADYQRPRPPVQPAAVTPPAASAFAAAAAFDLERAGRIESAELGAAIRAAFPEELYHAAHDRDSSLLLVLAWTLSPAQSTAARQLQLLTLQLGEARAQRCRRLNEELQRLERRLWLPLLEMAMPAIKQRPAEQLRYLFDLVEKITAVTDHQGLFEYVLLRVLDSYLRESPDTPLAGRSDPKRMRPTAALSALLTVLAAFGHDDAEAAAAAYRAGFDSLGQRAASRPRPDFNRLDEARDLSALDRALYTLASLGANGKRKVLNCVQLTIRHDNKIETAELELLRAIAASLAVPMPPAAELVQRRGAAN